MSNRTDIFAAQAASCTYCFATFDANGISALQWVDSGETAVCPHCSIDAVEAGILSRHELAAKHKIKFD
jgi:hypothetical protein